MVDVKEEDQQGNAEAPVVKMETEEPTRANNSDDNPKNTDNGIPTSKTKAKTLLDDNDDEEEDEEDEEVNEQPPGSKENDNKTEMNTSIVKDLIVKGDDTLTPSTTPWWQQSTTSSSVTRSSSSMKLPLLTDISTHANTTSDRFRNALARVQSNPLTEVEAWQALITEAHLSFKSELQSYQQYMIYVQQYNLSGGNNSTQMKPVLSMQFSKLDLIQSVYGALLSVFPYSACHYAGVIEVLMSISALPGEEGGAILLDANKNSVLLEQHGLNLAEEEMKQRQKDAEQKMDILFQIALGVNSDGSPFIQEADKNTSSAASSSDNEETARSAAYKCRTGPCSSSISLWLLYLKKRSRDAERLQRDDGDTQAIIDDTTSAYETALERAGFVPECQILWKAYLSFLQSQTTDSDSLDASSVSTTTATTPQQKQKANLALRSVYQRMISQPQPNLEETWREYEHFERQLSPQLAQALLTEHLPKVQHAKQIFMERRVYIQDIASCHLTKLATPPVDMDSTTPGAQQSFEMEKLLLQKWSKRLAYERSNPERLPASLLGNRVRQCYKEWLCVFMRHAEVWHEWGSWEGGGYCGGGCDAAHEVYILATAKLPESALLAASHSELLDSIGNHSGAISVLENYNAHSPCSLGFILLQKVVRRTQGIAAGRKVFRRARRILLCGVDENTATFAEGAVGAKGGPNDTLGAGTAAASSAGAVAAGTENTGTAGVGTAGEDDAAKKTMVKNKRNRKVQKERGERGLKDHRGTTGAMTWHVYASHAHMELRTNGLPDVAARVFELGLSKHRSFLSSPPYVLSYAHLLLERGDEDNLRALLERAISACEEAGLSKDHQRSLWDMLLEFECHNSKNGGDPNKIRLIEARRRRALGNDHDCIGESSIPKILQDQLSRADGENAGLISGGLGRLLERYELMGVVGECAGDDGGIGGGLAKGARAGDKGGVRAVDASFSRRYHGSMPSVAPSAIGGMGMIDRTKAARDRVLAASTQPSASNNPFAPSSLRPGLESQPEWLKPLILLLPTPRYHPSNAKPPPHIIEMALASLRAHPLPPKPSPEEGANGIKRGAGMGGTSVGRGKRRRSMEEDGNSSDEEGLASGGGYSNQFRLRQRARQEAAASAAPGGSGL